MLCNVTEVAILFETANNIFAKFQINWGSLLCKETYLSQACRSSSLNGTTILTCSWWERRRLAYCTTQWIQGSPLAVKPWRCFFLISSASAESPRAGIMFKCWSKLQRKYQLKNCSTTQDSMLNFMLMLIRASKCSNTAMWFFSWSKHSWFGNNKRAIFSNREFYNLTHPPFLYLHWSLCALLGERGIVRFF